MTKKLIAAVLVICLLFVASGCSVLDDAVSLITPTEKIFSLESYHLQLTADSTFVEKTGGSFDLQITNNRAYISVMAYQYIDLPQNVTPMDVYRAQNEDLFGKRTNVTVIEEAETQAILSAEKDGVKNYYATYLMDFSEEETFAWVLITAPPSYFEENRTYLHNIASSLTIAR